ncbi:MAG TPA: DUF4410 domain-containing protein [Candidatus Acidoferrales bacterium]|nr:DUF4410 domain-containing protein [Candidatus Acidoferrales bacterium]
MRAFSAIVAAVLMGVLFLPAAARAKDPDVKYKTVEAKHFDRAEGVELTPEFSDYLYAELRAQLEKTKIFGQVIGEGEVVEAADAPASVVVTGSLTEYKKGSVAKAVIIGYGAGRRSLKLQVNLARRSDQKSLGSLAVQVKADPRWSEKILAVEAAKQIAKEIKNSLEHEAT